MDPDLIPQRSNNPKPELTAYTARLLALFNFRPERSRFSVRFT